MTAIVKNESAVTNVEIKPTTPIKRLEATPMPLERATKPLPSFWAALLPMVALSLKIALVLFNLSISFVKFFAAGLFAFKAFLLLSKASAFCFVNTLN